MDKKTIVIIVLAVALGWLVLGPDSCPIRKACGLSKGHCEVKSESCCDSKKGEACEHDGAKKEAPSKASH